LDQRISSIPLQDEWRSNVRKLKFNNVPTTYWMNSSNCPLSELRFFRSCESISIEFLLFSMLMRPFCDRIAEHVDSVPAHSARNP
jgi:hypothetical protein